MQSLSDTLDLSALTSPMANKIVTSVIAAELWSSKHGHFNLSQIYPILAKTPAAPSKKSFSQQSPIFFFQMQQIPLSWHSSCLNSVSKPRMSLNYRWRADPEPFNWKACSLNFYMWHCANGKYELKAWGTSAIGCACVAQLLGWQNTTARYRHCTTLNLQQQVRFSVSNTVGKPLNVAKPSKDTLRLACSNAVFSQKT